MEKASILAQTEFLHQKRGKNARAIGLSENRSGGKRMKLREGNESMECAQLTILYRVTII